MSDNRSRDERVSAALDGEASKEEAGAIASDAGLRAQAERWRANDAAIRAAFDPVAESAIDEALLARLGLAAPSEQPGPSAANDNPPWRRWLLPAGAVAAGVAAMLALVPASGSIDLDRALDTTPSGQIAMVDGAELRPVLTVRAGDGRWCREYAYRGNRDLACRGTDGWSLEGRVTGPAAKPGEIQIAGGEAETGLEVAYAKLDATDPVGPADERAAIAAGWQPAAGASVN